MKLPKIGEDADGYTEMDMDFLNVCYTRAHLNILWYTEDF